MKNPFKKNKYEIAYNLFDCLIIVAITSITSIITQGITIESLCNGLLAGMLAAIVKLGKYWQSKSREYVRVLSFV